MCGRYIIVSKLEKIELRFDAKATEANLFNQSFNVSPGDKAPIITSEAPHLIKFYRFGLQPFWAKKAMFLINARSEGDFNQDNDYRYHGNLGIKDKPSFRKAFRSQRCLVLADAFIEGTVNEKLNKPFVVYPINKDDRPFAFAGLYDQWVDKSSGEIINSFSIITQPASKLLRRLPHHRSPVVLRNREEECKWLDTSQPMAEIEELLRFTDADRFNAYPIDKAIKNPKLKSRELIEPKGERILTEYNYVLHRDLELFGMGMSPARKRKIDNL
jgi:putative SOS response-associated peptidase YedK